MKFETFYEQYKNYKNQDLVSLCKSLSSLKDVPTDKIAEVIVNMQDEMAGFIVLEKAIQDGHKFTPHQVISFKNCIYDYDFKELIETTMKSKARFTIEQVVDNIEYFPKSYIKKIVQASYKLTSTQVAILEDYVDEEILMQKGPKGHRAYRHIEKQRQDEANEEASYRRIQAQIEARNRKESRSIGILGGILAYLGFKKLFGDDD